MGLVAIPTYERRQRPPDHGRPRERLGVAAKDAGVGMGRRGHPDPEDTGSGAQTPRGQ